MTTTAAQPTAAEVRAALERILRSRCFEHAGRASEFLRFVVDRTLAGDDRLKGYTIAIHVFGRPPEFNAQSDPLVRVEALRLRQRLADYYANEGSGDRVRLAVPRGGYTVKAAYAEEPPQPRDREQPQIAPPIASPRGTRARTGRWAASLLMIAAAGSITVQQQAPVAEQAAAVNSDRAHRTKIAVVPFESLTDTPGAKRLAAGVTEEIMLRLGELDLFVIDTQASAYRQNDMLDGVLGHEHTYVLTGSVREHVDGARVTARITEAATGTQIWSAAYDEPPGIKNEFSLQAEVARAAAAAAAPFGPVFDAELALARSEAHTVELPDCQVRYRAFRRAADPGLFPEAAACFQSLVVRRPEVAHGWAGLAMVAIDEHLFYSGTDNSPLERAWEATRRALALDDRNVLANAALARAQYYSGDPAFVATANKTLALDPDNVETMALMGILLTAYGDDVHGLELVARAQALSPHPRPTFNIAYAFADLSAAQPCQAQTAAEAMDSPRWFITYVLLSAAAALCGDERAAAEARLRLLSLAPNFESEGRTLVDYWRFNPALSEAVLTGLRRAGFELREG